MVYNGPVNRPGCCPLVTTSTSPAVKRSRPGPGSTAASTSALTRRGASGRGLAPPASGVVTIRGITSAPPSSRPSFAEHIRQEREHLGSGLAPCVRPEAGFATGSGEELFGAPVVFGGHLGKQQPRRAPPPPQDPLPPHGAA